MPELPEVETVVRTLSPRLTGRRIDRVHLLRPDILQPRTTDLPPLLLEKTILSISRRGKKIVFQLDTGNRFVIHLGMTGRLTLQAPHAVRQPHTHFMLDFPQTQLRFTDPRRFGGIFWLGQTQSPDDNLGPEPLNLRPKQLAALLSRTRRPIKSALMDQSLIAGLGNIYADEALFHAKIHPKNLSHRLTPRQIAALCRGIKLVLRRAIRHRGSTLRDYRDAGGQPGNFQNLHRVYDRAGQPCLLCRAPITRIVLAGRSAHFCPNCQT
ncbi:MAG: bifunctional DNA-formamidopyrimidine glycosylase/DNA-(apurinic or apyrimidinic site) lyase [Tepidisphaeraceae bacterium]|jgi:formamidopyrimidine-DNA glycosylase